jgi:DNA-binding response OmpR family regulator
LLFRESGNDAQERRERRLKRILIVDDEEDMIWTLQKNLKDETLPVDVMTAHSGEQALEKLRVDLVDLIISDVRMPGMSGLDLLMTVKKHYPQTEVMIMTAYPSPEFRREVLRRGGLQFVEKPFDINDLRETVREVLNGKSGFKGSVAGIELSDVIQLNCLSRATVALRVMAAHQEGMLFFKEGNIVHAVCDTAEGEDAFYEILGFENGTIESIASAESPAVTITQGFESLLMEGFRRVDEAKRNRPGRCLRGGGCPEGCGG